MEVLVEVEDVEVLVEEVEVLVLVVGLAVVVMSRHQPFRRPCIAGEEGPGLSSTTYRFHVPVAGRPLNTESIVAVPGVGAGARKVSVGPASSTSSSSSVGRNVPDDNCESAGRGAPAWSLRVRFTPVTALDAVSFPPTSEASSRRVLPSGATRRKSRSSGNGWDRPFKDTSTSVTVPAWLTTMGEG